MSHFTLGVYGFSVVIVALALSRLRHRACFLPPLAVARSEDQGACLKSFNKLLHAILLLLSVPGISLAQDSSLGTPYFSTRMLGVDLATTNVFINIPGRSKIGAIPFNASIALNSHIYIAQRALNGTLIYVIALSGISAVPTPTEGEFFWVSQAVTQLGPPCNQITYYGVIDGNGGLHSFGGGGGTIVASCLGIPNPTPTADGEYIVTWSGIATATAVRKDGMTSNSASGEVGTMIENPDGLSISESLGTPTTYTDTLGQTALTVNSGVASYTDAAGDTQSFTVTDTQYTSYTAFGCTAYGQGVGDMPGTGPTTLPTTLHTPEGTYTLAYESTKSGSGTYGPYTSGRIAKITYPSGAYMAYTYSGGNSGFQCASQVVPTLKVEVNDNNGNDMHWTFVNTNTTALPLYPGGPVGNYTVTETDPAGNQTVYSFAGEYQTQAVYYQGTSTILKTVSTCYGSGGATPPAPPNCASPTTAPHIPFSETDVYTSFGTSPANRVQTQYDAYANVTYVGEYGFGVSTPTTQIFNVYGQSYSSPTACNPYPSGTNIYNTPCYSHTENSSGTDVAKTKITYSNTGHPTQTVKWTGSSWLTSTATYNSNGTIASATDVNGTLFAYAYNGTGGCNLLLPTSVTATWSGPPSGDLSTSTQWDCNGGVATSTTDANGKATPINYVVSGVADPLYRPKSTVDPLSNVTNFSYSTTTVESAMNFNGTISTSDNLATSDGLGRPIFSQTRQAQGPSNPFDSTQTSYGWTTTSPTVPGGPFTKTSVPYSGTAGQSAPSGTSVTATQYDALGRPLTITDGGGGTVSYTYVQNDVLQSVGPTQSFQKQLEYDGLGRLTSVCEITSASGSGPCGQANAATGFLTKYTYDALGNRLSVAQNAQAGAIGGQQNRTYVYDGLSRMTSESNPESGTTQYFWDAAPPACLSPNGWATPGDLGATENNAGVYNCYGYDGVHRLQGTSPTNVTQCRGFVYDSGSPPTGVTVQNTSGHLVEAYTNSACNGHASVVTDEWFSYDIDGRMTDVYESTPNSGGYYHTTASYWANGAVDTLGGVPGLSGWTFVPDGEGRPSKATYGTSTNWVTGATYYPSNASNPPQNVVTFGNGSPGDTDTYGVDATTGRMNQFQFNVGSTPITMTGAVGWNANSTLGTLGITVSNNSSKQQNCSYVYDALSRLQSVDCLNGSTTEWNQSFTIDPFGNLSKSGTSSFTASYLLANGTTNNREQSVSSCIPTYDANGNLTKDCSFATPAIYAWDVNGNPTSLNGVGITYDALDREVEIASGSTYTQVLYSPIGKLGLMNGQSANTIRIPLPGGSMAELLGATGASTHILHSDWLGSARLVTSYTNREVVYETAYAPYGESYDGSSSDLNFTGQSQDTLSGLSDFLYRKYNPVQGRWISPDPSGLAAVDPASPQSWNRYAYALNNPLRNTDPLGLYCAYLNDSGDGAEEIDDDGDIDGCDDNGGYWIAGSYGAGSWLNINVNSGTVMGLGYDSTGNAEISVAGAAGSNAWGAWSENFGTGVAATMLSSNSSSWLGTFGSNLFSWRSFVLNTANLNPGSCFSAFIDTVAAPMKQIQSVAKTYVPAIVGAMQSAPSLTTSFGNYMRMVGDFTSTPAAETAEDIAGLSTVGAAAASAVPYVSAATPYIVPVGGDAVLLNGVIKEAQSAISGKCTP